MSSANAAKAIRDRLVTTPAVTDLVSTRIYPVAGPGEVNEDYIVYSVDGEDRAPRVHGKLVESTLDVLCVGNTTYRRSKDIAGAVSAVLDEKKWTSGDGSIYVRGAFLQDATDELLEPVDGSDKPIKATRMEFTLWHRAAS